MQWLEVTIKTVSQGLLMLEDRLTALGFDSFQVDDEQEFYEILEQTRPYWNYVDDELIHQMTGKSQVRLYLQADAAAPDTIAWLRDELAAFRSAFPQEPLGSLEVSAKTLDETDWENSWKQYYRPIPIGNRLLVVPQWMEPENPEGRLEVRLDPGMMFGTGDHASTRLCLGALETIIQGGESVLDLGTGSGILSFAALRLGAETALGVDIDPKGEDIARENGAYNGLTAPRFQAMTGNVLDLDLPQKYDVVLANIVADVILPLAPQIHRYLKPGGVFLCSGVLAERLSEVQAALTAAGICDQHTELLKDWSMCWGRFTPPEAVL